MGLMDFFMKKELQNVEETRLKDARKMLAKGVPADQVSKILGLSEREIECLLNETEK